MKLRKFKGIITIISLIVMGVILVSCRPEDDLYRNPTLENLVENSNAGNLTPKVNKHINDLVFEGKYEDWFNNKNLNVKKLKFVGANSDVLNKVSLYKNLKGLDFLLKGKVVITKGGNIDFDAEYFTPFSKYQKVFDFINYNETLKEKDKQYAKLNDKPRVQPLLETELKRINSSNLKNYKNNNYEDFVKKVDLVNVRMR